MNALPIIASVAPCQKDQCAGDETEFAMEEWLLWMIYLLSMMGFYKAV